MDKTMQQVISIQFLPITSLKPYPHNARIHSKHQIRQLAGSIRTFGLIRPVVIDEMNVILAGHGVVEAAKSLGMDSVPTIQILNLSEERKRAYILADNKLGENSTWDRGTLACELQDLLRIDCPEFDVTFTGFEMAEIDIVLEEANRDSQIEDESHEANFDQRPVTQLGDLWILGKHKVLCGNAIHDSSYKTLMVTRRASAAVSDPPYNVKIHGHATGNGAIHHREFGMASGDMSNAEFFSFLDNFVRLNASYSTADSIHYIFMDWRHVADLIAAGKQNYDEFVNICVWKKDSGGMGSFYRSQHEFVLVFRKGKGFHRNNVQLGKFGRNRTNVWEYPGVQTMSRQGDEGNLLALHPTVKPIALVADAILDCTARGEIILDSFLGSGTTLMAAERVGRLCYAIEIDPAYVDVAIRRWQKYTGESAVHVKSGKRFDEISSLAEAVDDAATEL